MNASIRKRGFSLIELMVVLAIMAVVLSSISPSVLDWMVNMRIRNAADAIVQGVQQARQEAVRRNVSVGFWLVTSASDPSTVDNTCALSNASGSWVVSVRSPVGACGAARSIDTAPMLVASHGMGDASSGVTVAGLATDGATSATMIRFSGTGIVALQTGDPGPAIARIDVRSTTGSSSHRSLRIEITGLGAIRLCDPAVSSGDARACRL